MKSILFIATLLVVAVAFVNGQACSGTVYYNNTFGVIRDHDGGGNYTRPSNCNWFINSPNDQPNNQITIVFNYLDTYGNAATQQFDFLDVKDGKGPNAPDLVWFYGYDQNIPPVLSTGSSMGLLWRAWAYAGNPPTGRGFELSYSSSSCPSQCNWKNNQGYCFNGQCYCSGGWTGPACDVPYCANNCGSSSRGTCQNGRCACVPGFYGGDCLAPTCDKQTVFTAHSIKNFSDHHAGLSGKNEYEHAANCSWLIKPDGASRVVLEFSAFDLEQDWDFLDIYDGESMTNSLIGRFSGNSLPPKITSSGPALLLHFTTDTGVASTGFTAGYTSLFTDADGKGGSNTSGYLVVAFLCTLLGSAIGAVGLHFYQKWQQKKDDVRYSTVAANEEDLLGEDI
eukprot:TRINITY_DN944_c0_g1_i1.p1 TRINITY_DN944_c0_g1~~TRINITY_DN944_c0_g1_i1.p1  ORF type:complete len:429 (-),score=97.90 TRINITY_DN944_c0_g1_i1:193-1377(-)